MKKQFLSFLLMLQPMLASAETIVIDGIWYNLVPKGKAAEVTSNPNKYSGDIVIPEKIKYEGVEYTVTTISNGSFYDCNELSSIKIPKTIQKIGEGVAFNFTMDFPVISIYIEDLEAWCNIDYQDSDYPGFDHYNLYLNGSKLVNLEIPNTVTTIKRRTFMNCENIQSVSIPNSVTSIGKSAFYNCSGLTSITIPNSVTSIGESAFSSCSGLTSVHISDLNAWCGIKYSNFQSNPLSEANHLYLNGEEIKDLVIPNSVTSIGEFAFYGCSGLTSIIIPNSVTSIGDGAFSECVELASVKIGNSVSSIGKNAFNNCNNLTSITIPNSVSSIGYSAFWGCSSLSSVHIMDLYAWCKISFNDGSSNPLYYANHLYLNGEEIKNLVIPNNVTSIGIYTFSGFSGLTSVTIPNSVTFIGKSAFSLCSNLTTLTIGANVNSISSYAFGGCSQLTDVYCFAEKLRSDQWYGEGLYTADEVFNGSLIEYASLHVPAASIEAYRSTAPWSQFMAFVSLEDGDNPEIKKCATPEISFTDGKLTFTCETEGADCVATITDPDITTHYGNEVTLSLKYTVSVYATKAGYENSEVATREIVIKGDNKAIVVGDVDGDGKVNVADHVKLSDIIMNK